MSAQVIKLPDLRKRGKWGISYFCERCLQEVSDHTRSYSNGLCPHCAHKARGTFMDTVDLPRRKVWNPKPWWKFWVRRTYDWEYRIEKGIPAHNIPAKVRLMVS